MQVANQELPASLIRFYVESSGNRDAPGALIRACMELAGTNYKKLAEHHDVSADTLRNALYRRAPKQEGIIAGALGLTPEDIWPNRWPGKSKSEQV
ncbi:MULTISPECIES: helix-turn-helix domain-containing protein [Serratia]|jgi:Ner family transcriptional regulator|uniref:helix-turn-helix domain-containing protein n=1 Tax=Serratia TaxID=613 RepID=UPI00143D64A3|nr:MULTISPECIES: helix-turn-helix domain-containing protein [unclassified Serratia (in: enterobacteria)]